MTGHSGERHECLIRHGHLTVRAVLAALFGTAWRDGESALTTALSAALLSVLILTMMAWEEAL
jgi:hypothetical protein